MRNTQIRPKMPTMVLRALGGMQMDEVYRYMVALELQNAVLTPTLGDTKHYCITFTRWVNTVGRETYLRDAGTCRLHIPWRDDWIDATVAAWVANMVLARAATLSHGETMIRLLLFNDLPSFKMALWQSEKIALSI